MTFMIFLFLNFWYSYKQIHMQLIFKAKYNIIKVFFNYICYQAYLNSPNANAFATKF
ncbi:hypothetical protein AAHE18_18G092500 [Arachis hypogaea]